MLRIRGRLPALGVLIGLAICQAAAAASNANSDAAAESVHRLMQEGTLNNNLGRYRAAETAFRAAQELCEGRFGSDDPSCGDVLVRLGMEISNQQRFEEAELTFRRAEDLVRRSASPLDLPRYITYRAMHLANRGDFEAAFTRVLDANQRRKALVKAEFAAAKSADAGAKRRLDTVLADLAHGLFVQAGITLRLGRLEEARLTARLARRLIVKALAAPDWWVAFVDELLAEVELRRGNHEAAERLLKLALKTKRLALGNTRAVAFSRLALGSVYHAGRRDFEAIETMRPGLAIVRGELDRAPGVGLDRLLPFLAAAHAEGARDPAKRAALAAEMFAASQLVRGGVTARSIAQAAARHASDDPEIADLVARAQAAVRHRDRLRLDLGRAAVSLNGKPDPKHIRRLRDGYAAATRAAAALQQELSAAFPEYSALVASPPVAAAQLQALLRPDEALVRFVVGDAGGFVFVVRSDAVTAAPLTITRAEMAAAVRRLRAPFETAGRRIAAFDLAAAHALYRALFGPIEDRLAGVRHLIAVSSGALLSLPLALLTTRPPAAAGATDYRSAAWLARKMAVSVLPSVRALVSLRTVIRPSAAPLPFIGFGDPAFTGRAGDGGLDRLARECRLGAPVAPGLIRRLAALPETAEELRRVARVLGAGPEDLYLGADASEARLRRLPMDQYRVVYFATHGLLPGQLRCQSEPALALSPPPAAVSDREADGLLDATEIAGMRLDADLVVLSACNTGGGGSGRFGGESLSGLVRAFFQAGARSLIVSHWQVDSRATVRLMTRLFERLAAARSLSPAEALRRAQLELIADPALAHPFFWAAFTFVGDGGRKLSW